MNLKTSHSQDYENNDGYDDNDDGFSVTLDVNECQTVGAKCANKKAGCENTEGSYECLCIGKDLYENFEGECRGKLV